MKSNGGLFTVLLQGGSHPLACQQVSAHGRGKLRKRGELLVGDYVTVTYEDTSVTENGVAVADGSGISIDEVLPEKNRLIRPCMANLDVLFVTVAAAQPEPQFETIDKLLSIAEFQKIEPVMVVTKADIDMESAQNIKSIYEKAGYKVFITGFGMDDTGLAQYIKENLKGKIAAFSGASGVGKSTMLNEIFPNLHALVGELSLRIERGKNTTRVVELYPLSDGADTGFLADTPGFTMLDFERFDFFSLEDLPTTFREFDAYTGACRYKKCSHTKEEGCAVLEAVKNGEISKSRHASFLSLYETLKKKPKYK